MNYPYCGREMKKGKLRGDCYYCDDCNKMTFNLLDTKKNHW